MGGKGGGSSQRFWASFRNFRSLVQRPQPYSLTSTLWRQELAYLVNIDTTPNGYVTSLAHNTEVRNERSYVSKFPHGVVYNDWRTGTSSSFPLWRNAWREEFIVANVNYIVGPKKWIERKFEYCLIYRFSFGVVWVRFGGNGFALILANVWNR